MLRQTLVLAAALALAGAPTTARADAPPCTHTCAGPGAFNPALSDSPVTVVFCTVPQACVLGPGGPR